MADATQARSDDASRNEELRPQRTETPIIATAKMLGRTEDFYTEADKASSRQFGKVPSLAAIHDRTYLALCEGQYGLLHLIPQGDDRDLMILAGAVAMLADQLPDFIGEDDSDHAKRICEGIKAATATISATLAQTWPAGPEAVDPLYPELARSIRRDVLVVTALRDDAERG